MMDRNLHHTKFGRFCDQRRKAMGTTLPLMADALGVDYAYVSAVEHGDIVPPECYVENVAAYLQVKIEYLKAMVAGVSPVVIDATPQSLTVDPWPENVVPFSEYKNRKWPKTPISPTD